MSHSQPVTARPTGVPANVAGVWSGILLVGVLDVRDHTARADQILSRWGLVELLWQFGHIGTEFWELLATPGREAVITSPGTAEYAVLHALGVLLGEEIIASEGYLPGPPTVRCLLQALMARHALFPPTVGAAKA